MRLVEKQQFMIIVIAVVLFGGIGLLRYYPLARQKVHVENASEDQLVAVAKTKTYGLQMPFLRKQEEALEKKVAVYDARIPPERHFAELWQQMAMLMSRYGLKDQNVEPKSELTAADMSCIPITVECSGSLDQCFKLIRSLQDFERLILIKNLTLTNDRNYSGQLKLTVDANVYYQNKKNNTM